MAYFSLITSTASIYPKSDRSQRYTETGLSQNALLDSENNATYHNAFETSPPYTQPIKIESQPIRHNVLEDNREYCESPSTIWTLENNADVDLGTVQGNLEHSVFSSRSWESAYNEHRIMGSQIKAEERKSDKQPSRTSGGSTCFTLSTGPSNPMSRPVFMPKNTFSRKESNMELSRSSSVKSSSQYSSSVPEPPKVPIPFMKTSRTNTQPIVGTHGCRLCPMSFASRKDLDRHVVSKHVDQPQWFCPVPNCKYATRGFKRKDKARAHINSQHINHPSAHIGPVDAQTRQRTQDTQNTSSRGSSRIYPYPNPRRSVAASSRASLSDEGSMSEANSCGSPLSSIAEPDLQPWQPFRNSGNDAFLGFDELFLDHFDHQHYFDHQREIMYTDLDKIAAQIEPEMRHESLGQGTDSSVKKEGEVFQDRVDVEDLIQVFPESNCDDEVKFAVKAKPLQADLADSGFQSLSYDVHYYTF